MKLGKTNVPTKGYINHPINPMMHLSEIRPHYYFSNHAKEAKTTYFICFFNMGIIKLLDMDKIYRIIFGYNDSTYFICLFNMGIIKLLDMDKIYRIIFGYNDSTYFICFFNMGIIKLLDMDKIYRIIFGYNEK